MSFYIKNLVHPLLKEKQKITLTKVVNFQCFFFYQPMNQIQCNAVYKRKISILRTVLHKLTFLQKLFQSIQKLECAIHSSFLNKKNYYFLRVTRNWNLGACFSSLIQNDFLLSSQVFPALQIVRNISCWNVLVYQPNGTCDLLKNNDISCNTKFEFFWKEKIFRNLIHFPSYSRFFF